MYKSFKTFKENREIMEFGRNYDALCQTIFESGMSFEEFWLEHGLPMFLQNQESEEVLIETWMDAVRGGVAGLGTLGKQAIGGGAKALTGATQAGYGALQAGAGLGKGALGGGFDTFQNGLSNLGNGLMGAASGVGQAALSPVSAGIRGYEAGKQGGMGMNTGNQFQQWMGTRKADPNQQSQPAATQSQQSLNLNQQGAATKAIADIRQAFNASMTNLKRSKDPATAVLATQFLDKINKYLDNLKVRNGGSVSQPT